MSVSIKKEKKREKEKKKKCYKLQKKKKKIIATHKARTVKMHEDRKGNILLGKTIVNEWNESVLFSFCTLFFVLVVVVFSFGSLPSFLFLCHD
jgi:hypothetical protein